MEWDQKRELHELSPTEIAKSQISGRIYKSSKSVQLVNPNFFFMHSKNNADGFVHVYYKKIVV